MNHIHLETCPSTQDHLIALNDLTQNTLVSTNLQTNGRGRRENGWESGDGSLSMSFTLAPNEVLTLTSAEVSVLICEYFKSVNVKWPNDLINSKGEKCGGVLLQKLGDFLIVGVGLNLTFTPVGKFSYPAGSISQPDNFFDIKKEALSIYEYILDNRLSPKSVLERWEKHCCHINRQVTLSEGTTKFHGKFLGIGTHGQATIENTFEIKEFYNGSLRIEN